MDFELKPGNWVRFTNNKYTEFEPCNKDEAHGILNPFLDEISTYDTVIVFLIPGITEPVRHTFDINPEKKKWEKEILDMEVEEARKNDPDCAGCWQIRNNEVIRY
jgi:hypothetical protein